MQNQKITGFHAHIYFDTATRSSADVLRNALIAELGDRVHVSRLVDHPIGPHPTPMFEVDFEMGSFAEVVPWLMLHHAGHSVLIHPITGDEIKDHFEHPLWLGEKLALDRSALL